MKLQPHHLLCINFFIGKGYSEEFTLNMTKTIKELKEENPSIEFSCNNDSLCDFCLNYINGVCKDFNKVSKYNSSVVNLLALQKDVYLFSELNQLTKEKILTKIPINNICGDCCFQDICLKLQKEKFLK